MHEANEFRNDIKKYEALNTAIVGVSADTIEAQTKFQEQAQPEFSAARGHGFQGDQAYDARRMKSFLGKTFLGIVRMTFWIGPDGKIRKIWNNVTPKGHGAEVLAALQQG